MITRTSIVKSVHATLLLSCLATTINASDIDARLSTREAYVGMPVVLEISINDAADYQQPTLPEIDGCEVRSAGRPAQSSQITIINGRRSESRSVTMQYLITPRRAGTFVVPAMTINVDGRDQKTQPLRFVATKSETGDLLFVEIAGGKEKVFVGQPLDLTLKIWIKPFADRAQQIKLSEAQMWQMISDQSSWGSFAKRMQELAENNQRPGGQEVLRDDGQGIERSYYLYEIDATVYPKRPGKINADDVRIVVNYPTALGKSRDPFADFFADSPFGGRSPLSQMMDDDFFASPFGNRLAVSASRPIVGEAKVDSTQVMPVPTTGRPADYRGAVGRYKIVTQATPTSVSAGDPITLQIGVAGTGPMELVQAPPLADLSKLNADFKVADQSLAGFVQDNTKVFSTTIRPRHEGITQIPAIPFSYFDPDTEKFETVMSEPISITVDKSETLALDTIIGKSRADSQQANDSELGSAKLQPDFTNQHAESILVSQSPVTSALWWWGFVIVPPLVWIAILLIRTRAAIVNCLPSFKTLRQRCLVAIERASSSSEIIDALVTHIARRTGQPCSNSNHAVGALRTSGMYQIAGEVEHFLQSCGHSDFNGAANNSLLELQQTARDLVEHLELAFASTKRSQVRGSQRRTDRKRNSADERMRRAGNTAGRAMMLLIAASISFAANSVIAADSPSQIHNDGVSRLSSLDSGVQLSQTQKLTILKEAGEIYTRATDTAKSDTAEAKALFTSAAEKYQILVDAGIHNSQLYTNLGNAYLQSNQLGKAIANYERAKRLHPGNRQLSVNLDFANSLVEQEKSPANETQPGASAVSLQAILQHLRTFNEMVIGFVGLPTMIWTLSIASLAFWGILIVRASGIRFITWPMAILPLLILAIALGSVALISTQLGDDFSGVLVADNVALHAGDGEQFDTLYSVDSAQGHRVHVLQERGLWTQIRTAHGHVGWVNTNDVERL